MGFPKGVIRELRVRVATRRWTSVLSASGGLTPDIRLPKLVIGKQPLAIHFEKIAFNDPSGKRYRYK
jgi:hypothetical protein